MSPAPSPLAVLIVGRKQRIVFLQNRCSHAFSMAVSMHFEGTQSCEIVCGGVYLTHCLM